MLPVTDQDANNGVAAALIDLEQTGENRFRSRYIQDNLMGMMFGGQPLAQALAAAGRTVPDWPAHQCSAQFLRPGNLQDPIDYRVESIRDGKRFATRQVVACQGDRAILLMTASFHQPDDGPVHQFSDPPKVPPPEASPTEAEFVRANADRLPDLAVRAFTRYFPVELRLPDPETAFFPRDNTPVRNYWFRLPSAAEVPAGLSQHCLLAFLSDFRLGGVTLSAHLLPTEVERIIIATLNHSLWFHRPVRTDQWLLFATDSPWTGAGRGLANGSIYNREGELVATTVQELMVGIR